MRAIVLAGGKGTRLKPYTTLVPKPLVPIGGEFSILEILIGQLSRQGFTHITLAVKHLSNLIMAFIGDGSRWNIKVDFSLEETPLSTVGPLTLISDLSEDFLVINGDILSNFDYGRFFKKHLKMKNKISISAFERTTHVDYGVLEFDENHMLTKFSEKPVYHHRVSMGIFCLHRSVVERLRKNQAYGFDDLMLDGIKHGESIWVKSFDGFWLDIGRPEDYDFANENYPEIKKKLGWVD